MKGKELLYTVISSFLLTIIWVISNVYHSYVTTTIDPVLQIQIVPIAPNFDTITIDKLKQREKVVPLAGPLTPQSQVTPTPSTPELVGEDAEISPLPSVTQTPEEIPDALPTVVPSP